MSDPQQDAAVEYVLKLSRTMTPTDLRWHARRESDGQVGAIVRGDRESARIFEARRRLYQAAEAMQG